MIDISFAVRRLAAGLMCSAALAGAGVLIVAAAPAWAVQIHQLSTSFDGSATPAGSFSNPNGVAVDHASGDVYVADMDHNVVDKFDASGTYLSQITGSTTPAGFFAFSTAAAVAVDNSGGAKAGHVYVVDFGADVVDEFDASGVYQGQITGGSGGPFPGIYGVDVDSAGNVWVYDANADIHEFDTSGTVVHEFNTGFGTSPGFAVDSGGHTYAVRGCGCTEKFDTPTASTPFADLGQVDGDFANSVAVDRTSDSVYVDIGSQVRIYDSAMGALNSFGSSELTDTGQGGIGLSGSGDAYVANPTDNKVYVYDAVTIPDPVVTIDPPSNVTSSHATFTGTVNPAGADPLDDTSWHFEYSLDGGSNWTSTAGGHIGTGTSDVPVSDEVSTFLPNQDVQVRLVATNTAGSRATSAVQSFTTVALAPTASTLPAQDVTPTHAALQALVGPEHSPTTYYFELGTTTAYGTSVPATQDADAGSGAAADTVFQQVRGLQPGTTYHYRVVVHNSTATITAQDESFTTPVTPSFGACPNARLRTGASAGLPDCRALELVSPPDKNGGDVMTVTQRTRAAADGSAVSFTSRNGFGDVQGTGVATEYMSVRSDDPTPGTNGWATHGITPPQRPIPFHLLTNGLDPGYRGEFSADLSKGAFLSWGPLSPEPSLESALSLYLREDLRTPGGSYTLLSPCPLCDAMSTPLPTPSVPLAQQPVIAGASSDFSHVIFESSIRLIAAAPVGGVKLYESQHGSLRLAGILPDGTPAPSSEAGQGAGGDGDSTYLTPHVISSDGSRIIFMVHEDTCAGFRCGQLYQRVDGASTVHLNASERATPDPQGAASATYWDASADGSRVFFTSNEALTDDAPIGGNVKLYMYDASKPDSDPHNLTVLNVDHEPADFSNDAVGVIGASADGHFVYFVATGQLVPGGPLLNSVSAGNLGIYLWHDGDVTFVAKFPQDSTGENLNAPWTGRIKQARVTPDGRHVLFVSGELVGPTGYDQGTCNDLAVGVGCRELYVYSTDTQRVQCASCNPSGAPATTDAFDGTDLNRGGPQTTNHLGRPLSDDGRRVFFSTAEALVPEDVNGRSDVYEYDVPSGTVHLLSSGRSPQDAHFMDASTNGDDVFFVTRQQLNGWDQDNNYDVYDARVDGGFADPPAAQAPCSGEGCQGASTPGPAALPPGSARLHGPGNVKSAPKKPKPVKCKRGFVRKRVKGKVKCVKKPKRRKAAKRAKAKAKPTAHKRRTR